MTDSAVLPVEPAAACPVCDDPTGRVRHSATEDRWFGVAGSWTYRQCSSCDGLWLDPRPATAALPAVYANYHTHVGTRRRPKRPSLWRSLRPYLPWHGSDRRGAVGYLDGFPAGRVLDVGCGNGARLVELSRQGWSAVGTDFDARAVEVAREAGVGNVRVGTIHDVDGSTSFDAITMFHVLEHVEDPLPTLVRARQLLRPGGVVSIVTPNASSWLHGIYGHRWRGLEPPRHLQIFSAAGLRRLLGDAGFVDVDTFSTARNASLLTIASGGRYEEHSPPRRVALLIKGELLQALEWARLRWQPYCGEELIAIASSDPAAVPG